MPPARRWTLAARSFARSWIAWRGAFGPRRALERRRATGLSALRGPCGRGGAAAGRGGSPSRADSRGMRAANRPICSSPIHGILMAGAAYAPLGADDPPARLAGMLEDLGRPIVLAAAEYRAKVESGAARVLDLHDAGEAEPLDLGAPDGLAYVLFTSGSTGRPKGVAVNSIRS